MPGTDEAWDGAKDEMDRRLWKFLSGRLMELAAARGLTYAQLSRKAGLAEGAVGDIIQERSINPRISTLLSLARVLDVPLASLMPDAGLPTAEVGGQKVYQIPLLEPKGELKQVVIAIGAELADKARKKKLLAWAVTSALQGNDVQLGDIVVADTSRKQADGSAFLMTLDGQVVVARAAWSPAHGMLRLEFDGMPPALIEQERSKVHGKVVYLVRPMV